VAFVIFGFWAAPLLLSTVVTHALRYLSLVVRFAGTAAGNDFLSLFGILISIGSILMIQSERRELALWVFYVLNGLMLLALSRKQLLALWNTLRQQSCGETVRRAFGGVARALGFIVKLIAFAFTLFFAVYGYAAIFVLHREEIAWQHALPCRIGLPGVFVVDDILVGVDANRRNLLTSAKLVPLTPNHPTDAFAIAIRTLGRSSHAYMSIQLVAEDAGRMVLAEHEGGGYHLEHGFFVVYLQLLANRWKPGIKDATLHLTIRPQGRPLVHAGWKVEASARLGIQRGASDETGLRFTIVDPIRSTSTCLKADGA
jgi:hypothetical protein